MISYAALFFSALVAATLVPMQSEAVLVALMIAVGNVLGAVINWYLGHMLARFQNRSWFPASPTQVKRAKAWYLRYGRWSLLGSWLPIVGDPITVAAGALGERFLPFVVLVSIAKSARYVFLAFITVPWL